MLRLRIERAHWPRHGLYLTDTPRPDCPDCEGDGAIEYPYGDSEGEYAGSNWEPCHCVNESCRWLILPLPSRRLPRNATDPWLNEPPF